MTEFWVSQGNKWCDICKIFISNNPASIRNHEYGQRHKENVSKRINTMREEKVTKEKETKEAARALEQIEARAKRSYQKDMASFQKARDSNLQALVAQDDGQGTTGFSGEWEYDNSSGYYYNQCNSCYYDPNSGFYYTESLGKWVTQEEVLAAIQISSEFTHKKPVLKKPSSSSPDAGLASEKEHAIIPQTAPPPGPIVSTSLNPMRNVNGIPSKLKVNKRKRLNEKPKVLSEGEAAALKAREAARKRVEKREKSLLGLYKH